jgi:hypothetical protein
MMLAPQEITPGYSSGTEVRKQYNVYANPSLQSYVDT